MGVASDDCVKWAGEGEVVKTRRKKRSVWDWQAVDDFGGRGAKGQIHNFKRSV